MSLHSRLLELAKGLDSLVGRPLARRAQPGQRLLPEDPTDILVIRLWGLGNLALMAPQFAAHDDRRVRLMTLKRNAPFMARQLPAVEVLPVPDPASLSFPGAVIGLARRLSRDPPQVIIDCEQFLRLPLVLARWASSAPCVGMDTPGQGRGPLLDGAVSYDPVRHVGESFAALWSRAGLETRSGPGGLRSTPERHLEVRRRCGLDDRLLVVLHPGSGDHFPGRRWPPERFGALLSLLADDGTYQFALTGSGDERQLIARALAVAGAACRSSLHDLSGRLETDGLVDLLSGAALLVTNDTGPLHLADALGTKVVGLFGPNTPHRYGPRRPGSLALHADLPCSPCLDDRNMKRSSCRHYSCMTSLSVHDVAEACHAALGVPLPQPHPDAHAHAT